MDQDQTQHPDAGDQTSRPDSPPPVTEAPKSRANGTAFSIGVAEHAVDEEGNELLDPCVKFEVNGEQLLITSTATLERFLDLLCVAGRKAFGATHAPLYVEKISKERTDVPEVLIDPESKR